MKIPKTMSISLILMTIIPLSAWAGQGGGGLTGSGGDGFIKNDECPNCPKSPQEGPSFNELEKAFENGVTPKSEQLVGNWKFVLSIVTDDFLRDVPAYIRFPQGMSPDGFKSNDGSDCLLLSITRQSTGFDDHPSVYYSLLNMGRKAYNQGPFEAEWHSGSVCLAQYSWRDGIDKAASISYACRLVENHADHLLCTETLYGEWNGKELQPYLGKVIGFLGFKKDQ
jgi:hypothetical protein